MAAQMEIHRVTVIRFILACCWLTAISSLAAQSRYFIADGPSDSCSSHIPHAQCSLSFFKGDCPRRRWNIHGSGLRQLKITRAFIRSRNGTCHFGINVRFALPKTQDSVSFEGVLVRVTKLDSVMRHSPPTWCFLFDLKNSNFTELRNATFEATVGSMSEEHAHASRYDVTVELLTMYEVVWREKLELVSPEHAQLQNCHIPSTTTTQSVSTETSTRTSSMPTTRQTSTPTTTRLPPPPLRRSDKPTTTNVIESEMTSQATPDSIKGPERKDVTTDEQLSVAVVGGLVACSIALIVVVVCLVWSCRSGRHLHDFVCYLRERHPSLRQPRQIPNAHGISDGTQESLHSWPLHYVMNSTPETPRRPIAAPPRVALPSPAPVTDTRESTPNGQLQDRSGGSSGQIFRGIPPNQESLTPEPDVVERSGEKAYLAPQASDRDGRSSDPRPNALNVSREGASPHSQPHPVVPPHVKPPDQDSGFVFTHPLLTPEPDFSPNVAGAPHARRETGGSSEHAVGSGGIPVNRPVHQGSQFRATGDDVHNTGPGESPPGSSTFDTSSGEGCTNFMHDLCQHQVGPIDWISESESVGECSRGIQVILTEGQNQRPPIPVVIEHLSVDSPSPKRLSAPSARSGCRSSTSSHCTNVDALMNDILGQIVPCRCLRCLESNPDYEGDTL